MSDIEALQGRTSQLDRKECQARSDERHDVESDTTRTRSPDLEASQQHFDLPPDGGFTAWSQVLVAHLVVFNTWGMANSFGVFEEHYVKAGLESKSNVAWIGSLQIFLVFLVGPLSGRALDSGHCRAVLLCGCALQLLGVFLASVPTERYWQLLLTQGLCEGLGNGVVFCPVIALVSTYFSKNRALAIACTASGASTGGIVMPLVAERLIPRVGFPWAMRTMGFIMLFNSLIVLTLVRTRTAARKTGPLVDLSAFREKAYAWFCVAAFLILWAAYFAYYYISTFGSAVIGVSPSTSLLLPLIMNAVGIPGRTIPAFISDRYLGPINTYILITLCGGIVLYGWTGVHQESRLYAFSVIYGLFGAAVQGLFPACCASLTVDLQKMGTRTGMIFSVASISALTGPPLAGRLIELDGGSYLYAQVFGGTAMTVGSLALIMSRISRTGMVLGRRI